VIVGLALLVLGGLTIYDASGVSFYQSTFNVLPLRFFHITDNLKDRTVITGSFRETAGRTIRFFIMNSAQFAAFEIGQGNASLFSSVNVNSASLSFTFSTPDAYFLVFAHGTGLLNVTETVTFQRSYFHVFSIELFSGIIVLGLGVLETYWGLRPKEETKRLTRQPGTSNAQP
jgi:hypothetical protein